MDLHDYVRIMRRNWILILVLLIAGIAGGSGYAALQHPKYQASTQLYVSVRTEGAATGDLVQGQTFARQMVTSYADIVGTALILDPVIQKLHLDTTSAQLASQVVATTPLNTVLINISVVDTDAERSAKIANAVAKSFTDAIQGTLEKPTGGTTASCR